MNENADNSRQPSEPLAPQPGCTSLPRWELGELPDPPVFTWRNGAALLGPGLFMAGAAIGGW